jgi:hypothetical protein
MPGVQCLFREETFSSEEYCGGKLWAGALGDLRDEWLMETDGDESMNCNHHVHLHPTSSQASFTPPNCGVGGEGGAAEGPQRLDRLHT